MMAERGAAFCGAWLRRGDVPLVAQGGGDFAPRLSGPLGGRAQLRGWRLPPLETPCPALGLTGLHGQRKDPVAYFSLLSLKILPCRVGDGRPRERESCLQSPVPVPEGLASCADPGRVWGRGEGLLSETPCHRRSLLCHMRGPSSLLLSLHLHL